MAIFDTLCRAFCLSFTLVVFYFYISLSSNVATNVFTSVPVFQAQVDAVFVTLPFYTKGTGAWKENDVSIVTQASADRLQRIQDMAEAWQGPMSVALYIKEDEELERVGEIFYGSGAMRAFVDIHLLFANQTRYPVNVLRNLALSNARTSMVLNLDADFIPSANMHKYLSGLERSNVTSLEAFVIPAFSTNLRPTYLPKTKVELLKAIKEKKVSPVNEGPCPKCHAPTNYPRWYISSSSYDVQYQWIYEPYLMFNKDLLPILFDERLKGYGFDKNTHVFSLAVAGYTFTVLPYPFVIHLDHEVTVWDGPDIISQQWDALAIVCDIIPRVKRKYEYSEKTSLFNEPIGQRCYTNEHW